MIENNRYSTASDQLKRSAVNNISDRGSIRGEIQKKIGNDCPLAYRTIRSELDRLRNGDGPNLIEAYTYRWNSHVGPEDDSVNNYRTETELEFWKSNCPIQLLEQHLLAIGVINSNLRGEADRVIADEIAGLFEYAKHSNFPAEIDWQRANTNYSSKPSEYLSTETEPRSDDQYQADARLAPY